MPLLQGLDLDPLAHRVDVEVSLVPVRGARPHRDQVPGLVHPRVSVIFANPHKGRMRVIWSLRAARAHHDECLRRPGVDQAVVHVGDGLAAVHGCPCRAAILGAERHIAVACELQQHE